MRTIQIFLIIMLVSFAGTSYAQTSKTDTISVSGNCGMCKNTIEKAAKKAGATYALWNEDAKKLVVKYAAARTDNKKIQKAVADSGYDTELYTATDEAYDKLHGCCKYDRTKKEANTETKKNEQ